MSQLDARVSQFQEMQDLGSNKKNERKQKAPAESAKQSNPPSRETKLDQVRASIGKKSGKKQQFGKQSYRTSNGKIVSKSTITKV